MKRIPIYLLAALVLSFMFLALPEKGNSSSLNACCIVDNQCVGCDSGTCGTSSEFCEESGGMAEHGICVNAIAGPFCDFSSDREDEEGCCVLEVNECLEDTGWRSCISDGEPELGGQVWLPGESCGDVPQCVVRNVPTVSEWGLIALAAVIGVAGISLMVIKRRKSTA